MSKSNTYPIDKKIGLFSKRAFKKACSPHGYQLMGLWACWSKYGDFSVMRRFVCWCSFSWSIWVTGEVVEAVEEDPEPEDAGGILEDMVRNEGMTDLGNWRWESCGPKWLNNSARIARKDWAAISRLEHENNIYSVSEGNLEVCCVFVTSVANKSARPHWPLSKLYFRFLLR